MKNIKHVFVFVLLMVSFSSFAQLKMSCVDLASVTNINDQVNLSLSCDEVTSQINKALYTQRKYSRLAVTIVNDSIVILGTDTFGPLNFNGKISRTYNHEASVGYLANFDELEVGLEVTYDSDNGFLAPFSADILLGEMDSIKVICYDVEFTLERLGCN